MKRFNKVVSFILGLFVLLVFMSIVGQSTKVKQGTQTTNVNPTKEQTAGVTMEKFTAIQEGMTYKEVSTILGSEGTISSSSEIAGIKTVLYTWKGTRFGANMNAMFQNDRMVSKAQFNLE